MNSQETHSNVTFRYRSHTHTQVRFVYTTSYQYSEGQVKRGEYIYDVSIRGVDGVVVSTISSDDPSSYSLIDTLDRIAPRMSEHK